MFPVTIDPTISITADTSDAWVYSDTPTTNYSSGITFEPAGSDTGGFIYKSLENFDLRRVGHRHHLRDLER